MTRVAMLVIQVVEIRWSKATRGAPRANERAALPRAFVHAGGDDACVIQRIRLDEADGFAAKAAPVERLAAAPAAVGALRIAALGGDRYTFGFGGTPMSGQPARRPVRAAFSLQPGQYVRLAVNARHASTAGQFYSEHVHHVACGERIPEQRFLAPPDQAIDLMADLF